MPKFKIQYVEEIHHWIEIEAESEEAAQAWVEAHDDCVPSELENVNHYEESFGSFHRGTFALDADGNYVGDGPVYYDPC